MKSDLRYTTGHCFSSFPLPIRTDRIYQFGESLHEERSLVLKKQCFGLTTLYQTLHDPDEISDDIQKLRDLHVEMDRAVATAYGWSDLDLGHDFHETKQGTRFTISESVRREVLARLLKLNHERYAEEVAQGLHDKKKPKAAKASRKSKGKASSEPDLFGEED